MTARSTIEERVCPTLAKAAAVDREEAVRRLDDARREIGGLEGTSTLDELRRDRRRDTP
jgi:hypothetical protein